MVYRKLFRAGNSWVVAIPRGNCRSLGIRPGDYVKVYQGKDGLLIKKDNGPESVRRQVAKKVRKKGGRKHG